MSGPVVFPDGSKLISLRARLGWTQAEAADKVGYSDRLIRKAEKGLPIRRRTLRELVASYSAWLPDEAGICWTQFQLDVQAPVLDGQQSDLQKMTEWSESANRMAAKLVNYFYKVYNQRDFDWVRTLVHPKVKFTSEGETRFGVEVVEQRTRALLEGFNPISIRFEFDRFHFAENNAAFTFVAEMKHVGDFFGIPATYRNVTVRNSSFVKFEQDLLVQILDQTDMASLFAQLKDEPPAVL